MNRKPVVMACALLTVMTFGIFVVAREATEVKMVHLGDCDWTVTKMHSEASVMREIDACVGATGGADQEFKSQNGPLSIITVTLKSRKTGQMELVPELFLVRDGGNYGVYLVCQGLRVADPKPSTEVQAFHPPSNGKIWPGHTGRLSVTAGQPVVIELLFERVVRDDAEILAASPATTVAGLK